MAHLHAVVNVISVDSDSMMASVCPVVLEVSTLTPTKEPAYHVLRIVKNVTQPRTVLNALNFS